jgi:putative DNA primase/helicase
MTNYTAGPPPDATTIARLAGGRACLEAALRYLRDYGWSVLCLCPADHVGIDRVVPGHSASCDKPGKRPWHRWLKYRDCLPTGAQVRSWWGKVPNANVGVALGPVSGLVRVDAEGQDAAAKVRELSGGRALPDTLAFQSGRKDGTGRGWLYAIPRGVLLKTTPKPLKVGEVRFQARGTQTVLPPSRHKDGNLYRWLPGHGPGEIEPAPMPDWMVALMWADARGAARGRSAGGLADGGRIAEGARNSTLTSMAGTMRRRGFGYNAIRAALLEENGERCDPPLEEAEVEAIARSVVRYKPAEVPAAGAARQGHQHISFEVEV